MLDRLKRVFSAADKPEGAAEHSDVAKPTLDPLAQWAGLQGLSYAKTADGRSLGMSGLVAGKPWKLERGPSSREYIHGEELKARAELQIDEDIVVLVMNRALKEVFEKSVYQTYTDTLQTGVDPKLPEEMRWLAMYEEIGWNGLSTGFLQRYSVLADDRRHAEILIDHKLVALMMSWPEPAPDAQVPFILMLLRGKSYLRMQYSPTDLPTLAHAALIFSTACESAVRRFSTDISL